MVTVALKFPAELGLNMTFIGTLCPAAIITGRLGAVREKSFVEITALLTVTDAAPVFIALTVMVLVLPAATLPKLRLLAGTERLPTCCCSVCPALTPWQPTSEARTARSSRTPAALPGCFEPAFVVVFRISKSMSQAPRISNNLENEAAHSEQSEAVGRGGDRYLRYMPRAAKRPVWQDPPVEPGFCYRNHRYGCNRLQLVAGIISLDSSCFGCRLRLTRIPTGGLMRLEGLGERAAL
jgi:hypothetical protein